MEKSREMNWMYLRRLVVNMQVRRKRCLHSGRKKRSGYADAQVNVNNIGIFRRKFKIRSHGPVQPFIFRPLQLSSFADKENPNKKSKIQPLSHFICFILSTLGWFSSIRLSAGDWQLIHLSVESFISIKCIMMKTENFFIKQTPYLTARNEEKLLAHCGIAFKWFQPFQVNPINRAAFTSFVDFFFFLILCHSSIDLQFVFISSQIFGFSTLKKHWVNAIPSFLNQKLNSPKIHLFEMSFQNYNLDIDSTIALFSMNKKRSLFLVVT